MDTEKKAIRKKLILQRDKIPLEDRRARSRLIMEQLIQMPEFSSSHSIMIYVSFASEVITKEIISHSLNNNKMVAVPVVDLAHHRLILSQIRHYNELVPSTYGIKEPHELRALSHDKIELFVLPGVGFDEKGTRLGYGGGYFDRLLTDLKPHQRVIGLAFERQIHQGLPRAQHDVLMDKVVTEQKIRSFGSMPLLEP